MYTCGRLIVTQKYSCSVSWKRWMICLAWHEYILKRLRFRTLWQKTLLWTVRVGPSMVTQFHKWGEFPPSVGYIVSERCNIRGFGDRSESWAKECGWLLKVGRGKKFSPRVHRKKVGHADSFILAKWHVRRWPQSVNKKIRIVLSHWIGSNLL